MSGTVGRIAKSLFIHALLMALVMGAAMLIIQGASSLDPAVRAGLTPRRQEARVTDMRELILWWTFAAFAVSCITSSLFLAVAERTNPNRKAEAQARMSLWFILLLVTVGMLGLTCWMVLFQGRAGISQYLSFDSWAPVLALSFVLSLVAYYVATGIAVKTSMRPAVPLGEAFPRFWSN